MAALLIMNITHGQRHLSLELGGSGGLASINYETNLSKSEKIQLHYRSAFSFAPIDRNNGNVLIFPQMIHLIYGKGMHKADLGAGLAPSFTTKLSGFYVRFPLSLGYRIQPREKNYYVRIAYTPILSFLFDAQWQHWAGITFARQLTSNTPKK